MDILSLVMDNYGSVLQVVGGITGALGVSLPFLKPSQTRAVGVGIGKLLKVLLRQKPKKKGHVKRLGNTLADFAEGLVEGLD